MIEPGQQHRENTGKKNAVESAGSADGSDRRAEPLHFVEIGEIGADQSAEAATGIGKGGPCFQVPKPTL